LSSLSWFSSLSFSSSFRLFSFSSEIRFFTAYTIQEKWMWET
jgi:hypothetical protein